MQGSISKKQKAATHLGQKGLEQTGRARPEAKNRQSDGRGGGKDDPDAENDVPRGHVGLVEILAEEAEQDVVEERERKADSDGVVGEHVARG
jgi:hypothetical protein